MDKRIEEMRDDISSAEKECRHYCKERRCHECFFFFAGIDCENQFIAEKLHAKGYRKQTEVAREIISEAEQAIFAHGTKYAIKRLEEIKKRFGVNKDE